jgi:hypothetical protein
MQCNTAKVLLVLVSRWGRSSTRTVIYKTRDDHGQQIVSGGRARSELRGTVLGQDIHRR